MSTNRSRPPGVIIPEIPYTDINGAADWLCRAFGFKKRLQIGNHRFQLTFGDSSVIAIEGYDSNPSCSIWVGVDNVDSCYEQAKAMGAEIIRAPADYPFGERQCSMKDIGGHRWTFSQTIADVDPSTWGGILFE